MKGLDLRRSVIASSLLFTVAACGGKGTPTAPSTSAARASVSVTALTVSGSKTNTGYQYAVHASVQNNGSATATLDAVTVTLISGGASLGQATITTPFSNTALAAGGSTDTRNITVTDDIAGHPYAESLAIGIAYSDSAGSQSASKTVSVPALPSAPAPPPQPSLVTLTGVANEQGAGPVSAMNIEIRDGPDAKKATTTDSAGRYTLGGLQPGTFTVRAWKSGYQDTDQKVTSNGGTVSLNFSVPKSSSSPPPPSQPAAADVEYVVQGVRSFVITISNEGEGTSQFTHVNLPWSYKFSHPVPTGQFLYVSAQNDLDNGCIRVQIYKLGILYKDSQSCGAYVIAEADGER